MQRQLVRAFFGGIADMAKGRLPTRSSDRDTLPDLPAMYAVVLLDDAVTPYDWVVRLLIVLFHKAENESLDLVREIDETGAAMVGVYTYDVAETKCMLAREISSCAGYPLQARMERQ